MLCSGVRGSVRVLVMLLAIAGLGAAESDPFRVALTGKYPPFSMYDAEGELVGFDVDVSKAVAAHLGRDLELVATAWDGILPGLLAEKYDAIIGSMAINPERAKQVDFSRPYYQSGAQLFVHQDLADEITSIDDCQAHRLGVNRGETFEHYLREHHPEIEVVTYKSTVDIFQDVANGRIAGFVSDRLLGAWQIKRQEMPFVPAGELLYRESMGIPVRPEDDALLRQINAALQEMRTSGKLDTLFEKWFGLDGAGGAEITAMTTPTVVRLLAKGFARTLLVAFASIAIGFALAVPGGVILNGQSLFVRQVLRTFNDFIRGTPVLIQLFFVYFGIGGWLAKEYDIELTAVTAAIATLAVNASAYMAEVVRSGLMSVDPGQREASRALGLSRWQVFSAVVWPQAFRIALPPLMNSVVALIKDTALVSVITVPEVIHQAQSIISITYEPSRYYLIVAVMFFVVTFPLMKLAGMLEARIRRRGFAND